MNKSWTFFLGCCLIWTIISVYKLQSSKVTSAFVSSTLFFANPKVAQPVVLEYTTPDPSTTQFEISKLPAHATLIPVSSLKFPIPGGYIVKESFLYFCQKLYLGKDSFQAILRETHSATILQVSDIDVIVRLSPIMRRNSLFWQHQFQASFVNLLPQDDIWNNQKYHSCAIVGNGGSLLNSSLGSQIDSHDMVIRFNLSPVLPFKKDVGTKLDIGLLGNMPDTIARSWSWNDSEIVEHPKITLLRHTAQSPQLVTEFQAKNKNTKFVFLDWTFFDVLGNTLNQFKPATINGTLNTSSGFRAVFASSLICKKITMYGFWDGQQNTHFFEEGLFREQLGHDYATEKKVYEALRTGRRDFAGMDNPFGLGPDFELKYGADHR